MIDSPPPAAPRNLTEARAATSPGLSRRAGRDPRCRALQILVFLLLAPFYIWLAQAGEYRFDWKRDSNHYYPLLARGLLAGHLYLTLEPPPGLLALKDPWDPVRNAPYRSLDAVLYKGRFYIYHGVTPALILFMPWRWLTHHDMPENFAVALCCLATWIVASELLIRLLSDVKRPVPIGLFALFLIALGLGQTAPFLLVRAVVYEVPLAAGYLFVACGFLFLYKALASGSKPIRAAALAGLSFGLAAGCRPHLGFGIIPGLVILIFRRSSAASESSERGPMARLLSRLGRREAIAFVIPALVCCAALAAYNYGRFGDPLEFGLKYQLAAGPDYRNPRLSMASLFPGLYYFLISTPLVEPVFPFFRLALRSPFNAGWQLVPPRYFIEPVAGILTIAPLTLLGLLAPLLARTLRQESAQAAYRAVASNSGRAAFQTLGVMYFHALACLLFISALGLTTHRFEPDFEPWLLMIGFIVAAAALARLNGFSRVVAGVFVALALSYSVVANAALAVGGPQDEIAHFRPASFVKLAGWFSPVERFRPVLNPEWRVRAYFDFPDRCAPGAKPLVSAGGIGSRYVLAADCNEKGNMVLTSAREPWSPDRRAAEIRKWKPGLNLVDVRFSPADRQVVVRFNGEVVLEHKTPFLVTAPAQVRIGTSDFFGLISRFPGRIMIVDKSIRPAAI